MQPLAPRRPLATLPRPSACTQARALYALLTRISLPQSLAGPSAPRSPMVVDAPAVRRRSLLSSASRPGAPPAPLPSVAFLAASHACGAAPA